MNVTEKIQIIGIGDDGPDGLTAQARRLIEGADLLIGDEPTLALVPGLGRSRLAIGGNLEAIVDRIAGAVARFLVPGPDPMGWIGTIVLGIIGSFVGGFLANLIFGGTVAISPAGIVGSIIGAIIVLLVWRQVGGRRAVV